MEKKKKGASEFVMEALLGEIREPGSTGLEVEEPERWWDGAVKYRLPADGPAKLLDKEGYISVDVRKLAADRDEGEEFVGRVCEIVDGRITAEDRAKLIAICKEARRGQEWRDPEYCDEAGAYGKEILPFIGGDLFRAFWTEFFEAGYYRSVPKGPDGSVAFAAVRLYEKICWYNDDLMMTPGPDAIFDFDHGGCHELYELYEHLAYLCGERVEYDRSEIFSVAANAYEALSAEKEPSDDEYRALLDEFDDAGIDVNSDTDDEDLVKKGRYVRCLIYNRLPWENYRRGWFVPEPHPVADTVTKSWESGFAKELMYLADERRAEEYFRER